MEYLHNTKLLKTTLILICFAVSIHLLVFASSILIPILFGFFLSVLVYTPMMMLRRLLIPKALAALIPIVFIFTLFIALMLLAYEPFLKKVETIPSTLRQLQLEFTPIKKAIDEVNVKTKKMEEMVNDALQKNNSDSKAIVVAKDEQRWDELLFAELGNLAWNFSVTLLLCYFFLVGGDALSKNIAMSFRQREKRAVVLSLTKKIRASLARYIAVTLCVNLAYGFLVSLILLYFGVDYALIWGAIIGLFRYVPYAGNIISLTAVTLAVAEQHLQLTNILVAPAATALLMFITGNFIDPIVHARQFHLNPIFIFITIIFWSWLWGIAGLFIAVPALLMIAVICSEVPSLHHIYVILCLNHQPRRLSEQLT